MCEDILQFKNITHMQKSQQICSLKWKIQQSLFKQMNSTQNNSLLGLQANLN